MTVFEQSRNKQCDQMLELKLTQSFTTVAKIVFFLKCDILHNSQECCQYIWASFIRKVVAKNFKKLPNLVTLD